VRQTDGYAFELEYPPTNDRMPQLPAPPAALVALRLPMPIEGVRLTGAGLQSARVWALLQAEGRFEKDDWHELDPTKINSNSFRMPAKIATRRVSALRFVAEIRGIDRRLSLIFSPAADASRQ
jgi:hypothetical protein